jgi:hypothetical protein
MYKKSFKTKRKAKDIIPDSAGSNVGEGEAGGNEYLARIKKK